MARLAVLLLPMLFASTYRVGCDCGGSLPAPVPPPPPPALTLTLKDPSTGSTTQTTQLTVDALITGDAEAAGWCLSEQSPCLGWVTARPAQITLSAGDGPKKVSLSIRDGGTASASITVVGSPPAITFHRRPVHISSARQAATLLSGRCGVPGGSIALSGGGQATTSCGSDAGWSATVDFSAAPDGPVDVTGVQWSSSGLLPSPPATHALLKDTAFCDNAANAAASPFAAGSGTDVDPYVLCTPAQLVALGASCSSSARLRNDIVLDGGQWPGLCLSTFGGTFDGADYAIVNLTNDAGASNYGLFLYVGGTLENVSLENVNIDGTTIVGALAGYTISTALVRNCSTSGVITSENGYHLGGIIGDHSGLLIDSESSVEMRCPGGYAVGGLIGHLYGVVQRSHSSGTVFAGSGAPGGIAGRVGDDAGSAPKISDSYATGAVTSGGSTLAGGLVGELITGDITRCYSTGGVSGAAPIGGLVAQVTLSGSVTDSYWDTDTSGVATSAGGTGATTGDMADAGTYAGWDFATVWMFDPAQSPFPVLRSAP